MNQKYVYLFELDSVRKSDKEIVAGQQALYREIVQNGNVVVLTYNQLVDSRAFFSFVDPENQAKNEDYKESLVWLFRHGKIRVSQYDDLRTVAQYILRAIDEDKQFVYSALPVKFTQRRLTALMRRSIMYSDLSELNEYREGGRKTVDELRDLFLEVTMQGNRPVISATPLDVDQMRTIIENLYYFIGMILEISTIHDMYIPPRSQKEITNLHLHHILECVMSLDFPEDPLWFPAVELLRGLPARGEGNDYRSVWHRQIHRVFEQKNSGKDSLRICRYAEAIVNLCYNYTCEISICNISKRYNIQELLPDSSDKSNVTETSMPTFREDFRRRLDKYWGMDDEDRFFQRESNRFQVFRRCHGDGIPNLSEAVRVVKYTEHGDFPEKHAETGAETGPSAGENLVRRYEYRGEVQRKEQKGRILAGIVPQFGMALLCILLAIGIEIFLQWLQNVFDVGVHIRTLWDSVLETILFLILSESLSVWISHRWSGFLPFSEAVARMGILLRDGIKALEIATDVPDRGLQVEQAEDGSTAVPIRCICTKEIRAYAGYQKKLKDRPAFAPSEQYPIADVSRPGIVQELLRLEELCSYRFGVLYQSAYNTFVVDPVERKGQEKTGENSDVGYFPYERVLPTNGDGVVMAVRCGERFLLLKQYRHALRTVQYSFPRGYAEPGADMRENISRELREELGTVLCGEPEFLGYLAPDSGLTSRRTAVWLVRVDHYEKCAGHEGILDVRAVTDEELEQMIREEKECFDDGYTIGAYEKYRVTKKSLSR